MFPPGSAPLPEAVETYRARRGDWSAGLVGPLVISDARLGEVAVPPDDPVPVTIVVSTGAGGVSAALHAAAAAPVVVQGVEVAIRDTEAPATAVRRVATAIGQCRDDGLLHDDARGVIELPRSDPDPRWLAAADAVAAAGLRLKFRTGGTEAAMFPSASTVAAWIDAALDRETAFKCTAGLHHGVRHRDKSTGFAHHGFLNVLLATRFALDGMSPTEVVDVLDNTYAGDVVAMTRGADLVGARSWFTSFGSCSVADPRDDLVGLGLWEPAG